MLTSIIPINPSIQAIIFLKVNFSCLKIRLAIISAQNALEPLKTVPLTPEVLARPI